VPWGFRRRWTDYWPLLSLAVSICKPRKASGSLV